MRGSLQKKDTVSKKEGGEPVVCVYCTEPYTVGYNITISCFICEREKIWFGRSVFLSD